MSNVVVLGVIALVLAFGVAIQIGAQQAVYRRTESLARIEANSQSLVRAMMSGQPWQLGQGENELTSAERSELFAEVGAGLVGTELERLRTMAETYDLTTLIDALDAKRWWHRLQAVSLAAALAIDDRRRPQLLDDVHPSVRAAAVAWSGRVGLATTAGRITDLLDDPDGTVRAKAFAVLSEAPPDTVSEDLIRILVTPRNRQMLLAALHLAASNQHPALAKQARMWSTDDDPEIRAAAIEAIATEGSQELVGLLADGDHTVRRAAVRGAGLSRKSELSGPVGCCLYDPCWEVRNAAVATLKQMAAPGALVLRVFSRAQMMDRSAD